ISGVALDALRRGDVVSYPGAIQPTPLIDLKLRLVAGAPRPLEQNDALDLFVGTSEVACHVTLLAAEEIRPGDEGWAQLRLERPVAVARGDRCIVRIPSPSLTIGGGRIVDAHPRRHRRFRSEVIAALETLQRGTPAELLAQAPGVEAPIEWAKLRQQSGLPAETADAALEEALRLGMLRRLDLRPDGGESSPISADTLLLGQQGWRRISELVTTSLHAFHTRNPLRAGMPREELKSKTGIRSARAFNELLARLQDEGLVVATEQTVRKPDFIPRLSSAQRAAVDTLLRDFAAAPFSPPTRPEWEAIGPDLVGYLLESGQLVRVSPDVLFSGEGYAKLVEWTVRLLDQGGEVTVATLRDQFSTSRKYALAFLEHLDERRITRRIGDVRVKY
ncbi:MAG TPA: SelB C-terminal domain-containing protein, partial [Herpetosiphonaceae bacterium]|nr:SelB C-terminal domain-containing protein [Herpetosiphonaceae bacterium]